MKSMRLGLVMLLATFTLTACGKTIEVIPGVMASSGSYEADGVDTGSEISFGFGGKVRTGNPLYVDGGIFWTALDGDVDDGFDSDDIPLGVLRFPVTAGFRLPIPVLSPRVFAGGVLNVVTDVKDNDFDIDDDDVSSAIWAGRVGAGAALLGFQFDLAYEFGLNDVLDDDFTEVKHNQWVLEAGFGFGI